MILITASAALCLTACGNGSENASGEKKSLAQTSEPTPAKESPKPTQTPTSTPTPTQTPEGSETIPTALHAHTEPVDKQAQYAAYQELLLKLYHDYELLYYETDPVKEHLREYAEEFSHLNEFALVDVDGDGSEELLVNATYNYMIIYDYDSERDLCYVQHEEHRQPMSFYENGTIRADWAHNQGKAGGFWPYTLYTYDKESDSYKEAGSVDAYDRSLYEANEEAFADEPFPYDTDTDGNGFVYYLTDAGDEPIQYIILNAVDDDEYEEWLRSYTDGTSKIEVDYHDVTEDEIASVLGSHNP